MNASGLTGLKVAVFGNLSLPSLVMNCNLHGRKKTEIIFCYFSLPKRNISSFYIDYLYYLHFEYYPHLCCYC